MKAKVIVKLKTGVLDPQGQATGQALTGLGFDMVHDVRIGKEITFNLTLDDAKAARKMVDDMCRRLLVNQVMETYEIELRDDDGTLLT